MDLFANETLIIPPNERKLIGTGIALAIPQNFVGLIWDKSGIASKNGLKVMAGVIDSNYRGEVKVLLHNLSSEKYEIIKGNKIAQLLIQPVTQFPILETDDLDQTSRGEKGFGSTGIK
jgi:dUTP pyrophosphatase